MNANLNRRLDALEEIAEEMRLRPFRELAEEHGVPLETLMELWDAARTETARLRAAGVSGDEIIRRQAEQLGMDPAELRREADELCARLNGHR